MASIYFRSNPTWRTATKCGQTRILILPPKRAESPLYQKSKVGSMAELDILTQIFRPTLHVALIFIQDENVRNLVSIRSPLRCSGFEMKQSTGDVK